MVQHELSTFLPLDWVREDHIREPSRQLGGIRAATRDDVSV